MHTTKFGKLGWVIHNGDWSGYAEIFLGNPDATGEELLKMAQPGPDGAQRIMLSGQVVLAMAKAILQEEFHKNNFPPAAELIDALPAYESPVAPIESCGCEAEPHTCSEDDEPVYEPLMPAVAASTTSKIAWTNGLGGPPVSPGSVVVQPGPLQVFAERLKMRAAKLADFPSDPFHRYTSHALAEVAAVLRFVLSGEDPFAGDPDPTVKTFQRDWLLARKNVAEFVAVLDFDGIENSPRRLHASCDALARRRILDGEVYIDGFLATDPDAPITGMLKEQFVVRMGNETRTVRVIP